jgi:hypothetical protein
MPTPPTMTAIRGESFLLGGSWRGCAYRLDGRAPSGPIFGTAPWRVASTSFGSKNGFVASGLPGMVTNFLAPLEPSIIVTVLEPGGGVSSGFAAGAEASGGEEVVPSWRECCLPSLSLSRALTEVGARRGARSGRLPRRKIPANHCASLARVVSVTVLSRQAGRTYSPKKRRGRPFSRPRECETQIAISSARVPWNSAGRPN